MEEVGNQSHFILSHFKDEEFWSNAKYGEYYYCHNKWHYRRFCRVLKQDFEDKKGMRKAL
jgi:hypothetical protein